MDTPPPNASPSQAPKPRRREVSDAAVPSPQALLRRDWIAGLDKGLAILEAFSDHWPRMSAAQVGERLGLTRTAARRHLLTLQHLGYLASDGRLFWLTARVLRLGQAYLDSSRLARIALPFLQRISAGTQEMAFASVLDGDEVVYVARNGPNRAMSTGYVLGARVPALVTAAGQLLLALREQPPLADWLADAPLRRYTSHTEADRSRLLLHLQHIRHRGWALSEQQLELQYRGVAVPVRDARGNAVGALSVTMPMGREAADSAVQRVLPVLLDNAQQLRPMV